MDQGARIAEDVGAEIIDINMGCPAKNVTNGESGSALMRDLDHALTLIEAVVRAVNVPVIRTRRPTDHRSRARRWHDAVAELTHLQAQYAAWLEALPPNLQDGLLADALQVICDFDLAELQAIDPPRGFGRD